MAEQPKPQKKKASIKVHVVVVVLSLVFIYVSADSIMNPQYGKDEVFLSDVLVLVLWGMVLGASIAYISVLRKFK